MGILQMCLVVAVLAIGALLISRDVDALVLLPIERMIKEVNAIRYDPLYATRLGESSDQTRKESYTRRGGKVIAGGGAATSHQTKAKMRAATMETKILENTII